VQLLELLLQQQPLLLVGRHLIRLPRLQPLRPQLRRLLLAVHQRQPQRLLEQQHPILMAPPLQVLLQPAQQLQELRQLESRVLPSVQLQQLQVTSHLQRRL
jgi:hypothetical protein